MISGRIQVNHSYDMLMRAQARYDYQLSYIKNIDRNVASDLIAKEKALLISLREKLAKARSSHQNLLQEELSTYANQEMRSHSFLR